VENNAQRFMRMAIRLAKRGVNRPSREPLAGVVVVADGLVVGRGFTREKRGGSAIISALADAGTRASGATLYTNIEPFCDCGYEESCVRCLIESRIARVVVGVTHERDQFSQARVSILDRLRSERIEIDTGVCEQACREVNEKYLKYAATGLPFVTVKFAQSLDGRIATASGDSRWISSQGTRRFAHQLRREHDAIMVGIGTVLADDPQLSVRLVKGRDPLRIVVDSGLRTPLTSRVFANGAASHTLVVTSEAADLIRERAIKGLGAEVLRFADEAGQSGVNIQRVFEALGRRGIASVLVEGGKGIITSLLEARSVDRLVVVVAPKIIGQGIEAIGDLGITRLEDAITFSSVKSRKLGPDIIFDGRLK
jgi:diaminohydroxyphosphoribosylaminopyrimidine deaminase / 5-amino-6-(5-phosphoribosylamino)uracil reductase